MARTQNVHQLLDSTGRRLDALGYGTGGKTKTLALADTASHRTALPLDTSQPGINGAVPSVPYALYSLKAIGGMLHIKLGDVTAVATTADGGWDLCLGSGEAVDDFPVVDGSLYLAAISDTAGASLKIAART